MLAAEQVAEDMLAAVPWTRLTAHIFGKHNKRAKTQANELCMHARSAARTSSLRITCIKLSWQRLEREIVNT